MFRRRPEILAHGQNLAADFAQIVHRLKKLRFRFAKAKHDAALRHHLWRKLFRALQNLQRSPVFRAGTHHRREPLDRFHVVIVNVGRGVEHDLDAPILSVKIGHQHFDDDLRIHFANGVDGPREMIRAAVLQIVARDRGDDDMFQLHPPHGFGDPLRFIFFQRKRFRRGDRAKSAGARATIARDHHRRRALAPAFPAIRALRAFANRVQPQIGNQRLRRKENGIRWQPHFDPGRLLRLVQRRIDFRAGHRMKVTTLKRLQKLNCGRHSCYSLAVIMDLFCRAGVSPNLRSLASTAATTARCIFHSFVLPVSAW